MLRLASILVLSFLVCGSTGCAWWKKTVYGDDDAPDERMVDNDMQVRTRSRSLTDRSSLPGGLSSEARAIERNLGVH